MQDIHTHLYWESYDEDREEVIQRAHEAGVETMLVVGTSIEENEGALMLAQKNQHLFASVGVHPNNFREAVSENWFTLLSEQAKTKEVIAIGECGLDYSESHGPIIDEQKNHQRTGFIQQLELAAELQLPVIVHCRAKNGESDDAYWDVLKILKEYQSEVKAIVLHCYMGSVAVTQEFLALPNVYFSFTGNITYPIKKSVEGGNFDLTKTVQQIPLERIFTETDCPFLAPQQYRGKRNEPAYVVEVAKKIAELHFVSVEKVENSTKENFSRVFTRPR